jgi:hypothetical protein
MMPMGVIFRSAFTTPKQNALAMDSAKRMILAHPGFQIHVAEQRSRSLVRPSRTRLPATGRLNHDDILKTRDFFNSLLDDVQKMSAEIGHQANGIILTGDIAFAGKAAEYDFA